MVTQEHFGEHLTIDGYGGDYNALNDRELIVNFIEELLQTLQMNKLSEVQILEAPDNQIKDPGGWSAFVIIAESHISIHTFPKRKFLSADVYTCRNGLDRNLILKIFKDKFKLESIEDNFIIRGKDYPQTNLL